MNVQMYSQSNMSMHMLGIVTTGMERERIASNNFYYFYPICKFDVVWILVSRCVTSRLTRTHTRLPFVMFVGLDVNPRTEKNMYVR